MVVRFPSSVDAMGSGFYLMEVPPFCFTALISFLLDLAWITVPSTQMRVPVAYFIADAHV